MDGGGQMSIEARSSAGVMGIYPGTQIATHRFVGNDAFCSSATAADQISTAIRLHVCLLFAYCHNLRRCLS